MFTSIADFKNSWKFESDATLRVLRNLTDQSLSQRVEPEGRTLARLAWHIVTTLAEMPHEAGVTTGDPSTDAPQPENAQMIATAYEESSRLMMIAIESAWNDEQLQDKIPMYGETWTKGAVLECLVTQQAHHRGQMTVRMRQAGLRVPGIYGPAREDWATMGIPAMA